MSESKEVSVKEIWKDVEGYDGMYQVSSLGRVRSWRHGNMHPGKRKSPRILKTSKRKGDYGRVALLKSGAQKTRTIHRLVAESFIPNPHNKPCVNHIDGDKHNNHISNLEWVTFSENSKHAIREGLHPGLKALKGETNRNSKLTKGDVRLIREMQGKVSGEQMSRIFKVSASNISAIINNKTWVDI